MTTFLVLVVTFKLIHQTLSQTCLGQYWSGSECNNATENCIWFASQQTYNEGDCYPNTPTNPCGDFYYIYECGFSASECCWYNFTEGESCTADCGGVTPSPVTPAPTFNQIGDFCYCPDAVNATEPTPAPTQKPTKSPTTPGTKKTKDKSTSGTCAINGYGECCCDKNYGQQTLTFINLDPQQRTIENMKWWFDGQSSDPNDIMCEYACIEYGESKTCNISGWDYDLGGNQRRRPPYDSFETNTYFDITYIGGAICYSYFHTSCSSDIVGYFDAKNTNECNIKCTAWTDANPNRIGDCNNAQQPCVCANDTLSPIPTATTPPSQSPTVFINSICIPTVNPTKSPTNNPIIPPTLSPIPTQSPSDAPSITTNQPTIQPSSAPTRTRAPSIPPTTYTISPTGIPSQYTNMPSISPTIYTNSPSELPSGISLAPVTAEPSSSPVITDEPSDIPTQKPTESPNDIPSESPNNIPTEFITTDDKPNGKGKGDGFGTGDSESDNGNMALIGGLIGGIIGAFLCGLLCAGIVFWKYKQGQNNGTASNFTAQDEHMQVEIENANNYNSKVNSNPMFTNNHNSFETYR